MKKLIYLTTVILFSSILFSACDLNVSPLGELPSDEIWNDRTMIDAFLNDVYGGIGHSHQSMMMSSGVDETIITHGWDDGVIKQSIMTPDDLGFWRNRGQFSHLRWEELYKNIRQLNILLDNISEFEGDESFANRIIGEAHFLRGYFYHILVRQWGGVPIITDIFSLGDDFDEFLASRNSFEETINQIVSDMEIAASLLPIEQVNLGRATRGAALAIKSRILLYAASDLYNVNPSGMPETGYLDGDQQTRWIAAKNAAQDVMDLGVYDLHHDYWELFHIEENDEAIFSRFFQIGSFTHRGSRARAPNGYLSWSGDTPLRQHVDAYEMEDGSEFDWGNSDHAAAPFENRDPRFYASILYPGAEWRQRPPGINAPNYQEALWYRVEGSDELIPGVDTRDSPIQDWNGTFTGFHMKKFLDPNTEPSNDPQTNPWIFIRYAEILLNYAEASIEIGEYEDARSAMNIVRQRAGMPDISNSETGQDLLERLRNERRVELAFEDLRYFDVRRWMIAPEVYSENGGGVQVIVVLDPNDGSEIEWIYNLRDIDVRQWNDAAYFLPIEREEVNSNANLVQNPGYD